MSDLLSSLKADLTSRRMLPLLALAGLALLGAIAYVALGAKPSSSTPSVGTSTTTQHVASLPGPAVSSAPANPNAAVSETTVGSNYQHGGKVHDPFTPLKGKASQAAASSSKSSGGGSGASPSTSSGTSSGSSSGTSSDGSSNSSGGSGGTPPSNENPSNSPTSISAYHIDVSLQRLSEEGQPVGKAQVFRDVIALQPLPSKRKALVEPEGVTGDGTGVAFVLVGEEIIHGKATCVPSAADCQDIDVKLKAPEELQYQEEDGTVVAYRLTVTRIEKVGGTASTASVHPSAAGRALIARRHLTIPSSAAFDGQLGTIVGDGGAASARAARHRRHS